MRFIHAVKFEQFFFIFFGRNLNNKQNHKNQNIYHSNFCRCAAAAGEANEMPFKCFFISSQISKGVPHTRGGEGGRREWLKLKLRKDFNSCRRRLRLRWVAILYWAAHLEASVVEQGCAGGAGAWGAGWGSAVPLCGCTAINNLRK